MGERPKKRVDLETTPYPKTSLDIYADRLRSRKCYFRIDRTGEIAHRTLWTVREHIDVGVLPFETQAKLEKEDPWFYFVELEAKLFTRSEYETVYHHFLLSRKPGYFYFHENEVHGPLFLDQIRDLIHAGELKPDLLICLSDTEAWMPIHDVG